MKCDFRETIIILTSNVGAGQRKAAIGFVKASAEEEADELEKAVPDAARKLFRPEFLNRLTDMVVLPTAWSRGGACGHCLLSDPSSVNRSQRMS